MNIETRRAPRFVRALTVCIVGGLLGLAHVSPTSPAGPPAHNVSDARDLLHKDAEALAGGFWANEFDGCVDRAVKGIMDDVNAPEVGDQVEARQAERDVELQRCEADAGSRYMRAVDGL
jgi:hypothetical protein